MRARGSKALVASGRVSYHGICAFYCLLRSALDFRVISTGYNDLFEKHLKHRGSFELTRRCISEQAIQ